VADALIISGTEALIRHINPAAPIHHTVKGEIDLKHIIGISAYRNPPPPTGISPNNPVNTTGKVSKQHDHIHAADDDCEEGTSHATHYELRGISSIQARCPILLSQIHFDALDEWIRNALWENRVCVRTEDSSLGGDRVCEVQILRCKGAFRDEQNKWHVLQGVRSVYEISELETEHGSRHWESVDVPDKGKIVLIGKGLNEKVKASLERILL
jgi:G3E family GTPase